MADEEFAKSLAAVKSLIDQLNRATPRTALNIQGGTAIITNNTFRGYENPITAKDAVSFISGNRMYADRRSEILDELIALELGLRRRDVQEVRTRFGWLKTNAVPMASFLTSIAEFVRIIEGH